MANKIWKAKEAVVKVDLASNVEITTSAALDTFFSSGTAVEGLMKDVEVTEPMGDYSKIDLLGEDTNGYQNAEGEENPASMGEISGTLIVPGDEGVEEFFYDAGTSVSTTHTRYNPGKAARRPLAILLNLDDTTDEVSIVLTNLRITSKNTRVTGADGHFEATFTGKCLPRDFHGPEFKD